jgi:hypothetical protein
MNMTKQKQKSAAIITVFDPANMTVKGRKAVAAWMRKQASFVEMHPKQLSKRFTARYLYA